MRMTHERIEPTVNNEKKRSRTMTTSHDRGSARIYQFPPQGRFAAGSQRDEFKSASGATSPRVAMTLCGGNWYHEEAIREAERARQG